MNPEEELPPQQPQEGEVPAEQPPAYQEPQYPHEDAQPGVYDDVTHQPPAGAQPEYADPNQAYVDPNQQAYVDPNQQAYVDPNQQAYVDPNQQVYQDPGAPPAPGAHGAGVYDEAPPQPAQQQPAPGQIQRSAPRRVTKKKVVTRRPGGARPRPGAAARKTPYKRPAPTYGGGGMMNVFIGLIGVAMLVLVVMVILPKDMSGIAGYPINPMNKTEPRNLLSEAQKVMVSSSDEAVISEADLNAYLNHRIQGEQGGLMGSMVSFKGVYVDLMPNGAEIYVLREFFGMPVTLTSRFKADSFKYQMRYEPVEWTIGKISFGSRNIKPVIDMFGRIKDATQEEFYTLQQLGEIRFERDQVTLVSNK